MSIIKNSRTHSIRRPRSAVTRLRTATIALAMSLLAPVAANANCEVVDPLISEEAAFRLDPGGVRSALYKAGVSVGGAYVAEPFYNWGGFDEGGEYQGRARALR